MRTIYLVRHTEYSEKMVKLPGRLPVPLTARGTKQAQTLAKFFQGKNISTIYASAILRTKQTAQIISSGKIPVVFDPRLLETFYAAQGYWKLDWQPYLDWQETLGGETYRQVQKRVMDFWGDVIMNRKNGGNAIICSHADPLTLLALGLQNLPLPPNNIFTSIAYPHEYPHKGQVREIKIADHGALVICQAVTV